MQEVSEIWLSWSGAESLTFPSVCEGVTKPPQKWVLSNDNTEHRQTQENTYIYKKNDALAKRLLRQYSQNYTMLRLTKRI